MDEEDIPESVLQRLRETFDLIRWDQELGIDPDEP